MGFKLARGEGVEVRRGAASRKELGSGGRPGAWDADGGWGVGEEIAAGKELRFSSKRGCV